jgi:predicted kinase
VPPVLVVIGGLPAAGKSTIAVPLATRMACPYLRVDRIEQTLVMWSALSHPVGPVGYAVAYELAAEQLQIGLDVVVECVNPIAVTRDAWRTTAEAAGAAPAEVEIICSDEAEHRRRVENRISDVAGLRKPTWSEVLGREYEAWNRPHLVVDSSASPVGDTVEQIVATVAAARAG